MEDRKRPRKLALTGVLLGLLAFAGAVFHFFGGPIEEPPTIEAYVADKATSMKEALAAKARGEEYEPPAAADGYDADDIADMAIVGGGVLAVALGVFGFVNREDRRPSGAALVLGAAAITFQFIVTLVMVIVGVVIIVAIISSGGLS